MDKKYLKKLKEEKDNYEELCNEPPFPAEELTEEVFLLLDEYLRGEFSFDGKAVTCSFANGQKFILKAVEVK